VTVLRVLVALCLALVAAGCRGPVPGDSSVTEGRETLAVVGARIYTSPVEVAIANGTVVMTEGVITAVGPRDQIRVPKGATVVDGVGLTVTAGFWNTHVHFMEGRWQGAGSRPAAELTAGLRAMLTRWGVVRVVDTGSLLENTLALRRRIESGEIPGPQITIAGGGFVPVGGSPYYVLPARLPELADAGRASTAVDRLLDEPGVDAVKLFTGSWATRESIIVMPVDVVRAAVEAAHRRGKPVLSHPSNTAGAFAALDGGVDILAHTFPTGPDWDRSLPRRMREANMGLIPTLKLWPWELGRLGVPPAVIERVQANALAQVRAFVEAGGQLLFGTDVGYMTDYDPTDEYLLLQRAGLGFPAILAALTIAPTKRFGAETGAGLLAVGSPAELVLLDGDPATDIRALANVRYTIRRGRIIYGIRP
jgi:imidazolonepropionase-like amidohydrolase